VEVHRQAGPTQVSLHNQAVEALEEGTKVNCAGLSPVLARCRRSRRPRAWIRGLRRASEKGPWLRTLPQCDHVAGVRAGAVGVRTLLRPRVAAA
jgi:hypothetical protein